MGSKKKCQRVNVKLSKSFSNNYLPFNYLPFVSPLHLSDGEGLQSRQLQPSFLASYQLLKLPSIDSFHSHKLDREYYESAWMLLDMSNNMPRHSPLFLLA
jgi:hypothetical protein